MKKIVVIQLIISMAIAFTACGNEDKNIVHEKSNPIVEITDEMLTFPFPYYPGTRNTGGITAALSEDAAAEMKSIFEKYDYELYNEKISTVKGVADMRCIKFSEFDNNGKKIIFAFSKTEESAIYVSHSLEDESYSKSTQNISAKDIERIVELSGNSYF